MVVLGVGQHVGDMNSPAFERGPTHGGRAVQAQAGSAQQTLRGPG